MECSIIVLSFERPNHLKTTLESIKKFLLGPKFYRELILIDNNSKDCDVDNILEEYALEGHIVIKNEKNLLFSAGMNMGVKAAKGEYVILCNDDLEFTSDILTPMLSFMKDNPGIGTLTPVTLRRNNMVYCSGAFGAGTHRTDIINKPRATEWNNMAIFLTRREYFKKIGPLRDDGRFEHYSSDEEWCRRMTKMLPTLIHVVHPVQAYHYYKDG
ncbi:hypothetical protein LCGC14_1140290 [marine sediment metagenome]|uniref:Glycosyltransferase 2-like domain-containing protein n=1 Tax=marine sediment metagenome TaxID=412755 RepID=A0A0F9LYE1_9ZZZZ